MSRQNDGICFLFVIRWLGDFCACVRVVSSIMDVRPHDIIKAITLAWKSWQELQRICVCQPLDAWLSGNVIATARDLISSLMTFLARIPLLDFYKIIVKSIFSFHWIANSNEWLVSISSFPNFIYCHLVFRLRSCLKCVPSWEQNIF